MPKPTKTQPVDDAINTALDETIGFEQAYVELEKIVEQLEQGDLPLEQSLSLHARGQLLAAHCASKLEQAELRVRTLSEKLAADE